MIPVSDAMLSTSPGMPQLQVGIGWSRPGGRPAGSGRGRARRPCRPRPGRPGRPRPPRRPARCRRSPRPTIAGGVGAEVDVVGVQRGGVGVVVVDDRQADAGLERAPDVEAAPRGLREVRRALGRDHAVGAGRARRVEPDRPDRRRGGAGRRSRTWSDRLGHGVDGRIGALADQARRSRPADRPGTAPIGIEHRRVVLGPAVVDAHNDPVAGALHLRSLLPSPLGRRRRLQSNTSWTACRRRASQVGHDGRRIGHGHDVAHDGAADGVAVHPQQVERGGGEASTVPGRRGPEGHPADLCTADGEAVVVELLAEAHLLGTVLVEGEVDHGPLGAEGAQARRSPLPGPGTGTPRRRPGRRGRAPSGPSPTPPGPPSPRPRAPGPGRRPPRGAPESRSTTAISAATVRRAKRAVSRPTTPAPTPRRGGRARRRRARGSVPTESSAAAWSRPLAQIGPMWAT